MRRWNWRLILSSFLVLFILFALISGEPTEAVLHKDSNRQLSPPNGLSLGRVQGLSTTSSTPPQTHKFTLKIKSEALNKGKDLEYAFKNGNLELALSNQSAKKLKPLKDRK